jgi:hypothetical protein
MNKTEKERAVQDLPNSAIAPPSRKLKLVILVGVRIYIEESNRLWQ